MSWANIWQLSVSIDKCCVLNTCIGKGVVPSQFYIKDSRLPTVSSCRDLGVTINTDLSSSILIQANMHLLSEVEYLKSLNSECSLGSIGHGPVRTDPCTRLLPKVKG